MGIILVVALLSSSVQANSDFSITLEPSGFTIVQGQERAITIGIVRTNGFDANRNTFGAAGGENWQYVSAGGTHTLAIGAGGVVAAWGSNDRGQLGHGSPSPRGNGPVSGVPVRWP